MTDMKQTKLPVSVFSESDIMECHFGHRWNKWEQIESNTTAVKYHGNICPVCSNERTTIYGNPVYKEVRQ